MKRLLLHVVAALSLLIVVGAGVGWVVSWYCSPKLALRFPGERVAVVGLSASGVVLWNITRPDIDYMRPWWFRVDRAMTKSDWFDGPANSGDIAIPRAGFLVIDNNPDHAFHLVLIPSWLLMLISLPWPVLWWRDQRARRRLVEGGCPACGYDLRGSPVGGDCPECGANQAKTA